MLNVLSVLDEQIPRKDCCFEGSCDEVWVCVHAVEDLYTSYHKSVVRPGRGHMAQVKLVCEHAHEAVPRGPAFHVG